MTRCSSSIRLDSSAWMWGCVESDGVTIYTPIRQHNDTPHPTPHNQPTNHTYLLHPQIIHRGPQREARVVRVALNGRRRAARLQL